MRPVALFGANGAGKTNVLEAVSMLSPGRGLRSAGPGQQERHRVGAGWRLRALIDTREVQTAAPPGGGREVVIDGKAATQASLGRLLRVLWLVPAMDRLWTDAPEGRRRFLDRLTLSFAPGHAEESLIYEKAMRERNRLLRDHADDPSWYRALERQMAQAGAAICANRHAALRALAAAQQGGVTGFPAAHLTLLDGAAGDDGAGDQPSATAHDDAPGQAEALAERWARLRRRDMAAGRTLTGPHRADLGAVWGPQQMPAAAASTGEQKALLLSLILANARALAAERPVLLLDEVAAHLDADRRAMLYHEISALNVQAILTGTGAELFEALDGRRMLVARDGDRSSLTEAA